MLTCAQLGDTDVVHARVDGPVPAGSMDELRVLADGVARAHGQVKLLVEYVSLGAVGPATLWHDLRAAGSLRGLTRVAVLAEASWLERLLAAEYRSTTVRVRRFEPRERDQAESWLLGTPGARELDAESGWPDGPSS